MEIIDWPISNRVKSALLKQNLDLEKLKELTLDDLKELEGLGSKGISEVRDYCYSKFGITFKRRKVEKKKKVEDFSAAKQVVEHFLSQQIKEKKFIEWSKQILAANKLLQKNPLSTLLSVKPNPKIYSLVWYLQDYGQKYINENLPVTIVVEEKLEKIEEITNTEPLEMVQQKPKSLKDFLKLR